VKSRWAF